MLASVSYIYPDAGSICNLINLFNKIGLNARGQEREKNNRSKEIDALVWYSLLCIMGFAGLDSAYIVAVQGKTG